jgi:DNA-binding CsgD family transcriptional regulator
MTQLVTQRETRLGRLDLETPDQEICWAALTQDAAAGVAVFDANASIEYANAAANWWIAGDRTAGVVGRCLADFFPPDFVHERLALIRRTLAQHRMCAVIGLVRGVWTRMVLRPIASTDGEPGRVLCVCRLTIRPAGLLPQEDGADVVAATVHDRGRLDALSERELEVLTMIGLGLSTADIATRLHRSVKTVEWHRVALGIKLAAGNRVDLARIAMAAGLVGPPDGCFAP